MQGNPEVLTALSELLSAEMAAINTYFIQARLLDNWGYQRLGAKTYEESMSEMRHADELVQRIIYLDGIPNLNKLGQVKPGETVPEQFELALELERSQCQRLIDTVGLCRTAGDDGTRLVLEPMITAGEETIDWLETQLSLIAALGEANYLTQQLHAPG